MKLLILIVSLQGLVLFALENTEPKVAPYIYAGEDLLGLKQKYGLNGVTLAFVLSKDNQCNPMWNGWEDLDNNDVISKIKAFTSAGGQVIVSSGGAEGKYLENGCSSAEALASAYEKVVAVAGTTHLDLDIEQDIDTNKVMQAVAQVQKKNAAVTLSLTIGINYQGIVDKWLTIIRTAVEGGARVETVNVMAMDYNSDRKWSDAVPAGVDATVKSMKKVWPNKSDEELYAMVGITPMLGRNDDGRAFTLDDAERTVQWAKSKGIGRLSFWAMGRDNGKCPNQQGAASDDCSGIAQDDHQFTKIFVKFQ